MTALAEAAVLYAQRGYSVFPVGDDKSPRTPRGHLDATTDVATLESWPWDGGIGLVIPARTFVVDVDPRNGGAETMAALVNAYGSLPATRLVRTRSGGEHWYYRLPDDRDLRGRLGPGVDIKKPGRGYVLVPPTEGYSYLRGGRPAPAPDWLLAELTMGTRSVNDFSKPKYFKVAGGTPYGLAAFKQKCEQVRECGEGGRRANLNTCAFVLATLVAGGELDEDKALEGLLEAALDSGLTEQQALSGMRSGFAAGLQNPRQADGPLETERTLARDGMDRALAAAEPDWRAVADQALRRLAAQGVPFNSDEVNAELRALGFTESYAMGAVFSHAARTGLIRRTGEKRQTNIAGGHARAYDLWVGA